VKTPALRVACIARTCEAVRIVCRSIKVLRKPEQPPTAEELSSAALQFVRKITGFHKPSKANQEAFERAVREISASSDRLLKSIGLAAPRRASQVMTGSEAAQAGETTG
jgi:hypothetical protein